MAVGWNFERRRDTCTLFAMGVSLLTKGVAERETSLEAVRARMRLSPEEARFAARRLDEEKLIAFDEAGGVRSNARGIARAEALVSAVRSKVQRHADVLRLLAAGGPPVAVLAAVIREDGAPLPCGAPDADLDGTYRLTVVEDVVLLERQLTDGSFAAAPLGSGGTSR